MTTCYKHTQIGYVIIASIGAVILVTTIIGIFIPNDFWYIFALTLFLLLCLALFPFLNIQITEEFILLNYGFIRKTMRINEIKNTSIVKLPWYFGWGIRWTPEGWLYRVSGFNAVKIEMKSGKIIFVGSDEADKLNKAILSQLRFSS